MAVYTVLWCVCTGGKACAYGCWLMKFQLVHPGRTARVAIWQRSGVRMAAGGRDLWRHLVQPLPKQGHHEEAAQEHLQAASGDLGIVTSVKV